MENFQLVVSGLANGCVYGLIALGFVLIYKAAEQVNFAQGDMMMLAAAMHAATPALADQGVSDDEIVVGSVSDLSGIFAAFGAPAVATAQMHFDEVTAAGIAAYRKSFGEFPGTGALLGYMGARGFTRALEKAGRDLAVDSFVNAMENLDYYDPLSDNQVSYSAGDHKGADATILSVIEDGRRKEVARLK